MLTIEERVNALATVDLISEAATSSNSAREETC